MTSEEYKKLSLKEFDRAAAKFDDDDPSVYNMCRKDYPDVLTEAVREPFLDLLEMMIETAKKKHYEGIHFVAGDWENLPFADNSFVM